MVNGPRQLTKQVRSAGKHHSVWRGFCIAVLLVVSPWTDRPAEANNPYYFSDQKPRISSSQLTNHYETSPFSPNIEVGKITYLFPAESKRIYWLGKSDIQTRPYEIYAVWYAPDGSEYFRKRCDWKGTSDYRTMLKLPRKKKPELLGQWRLDIEDVSGDVLLRDHFYIGPALNIIDENPVTRWSNPDYAIETAPALILNYDVRVKVSRELGISKTIYKRVKILTDAGKSYNEFYESYKEKQFPRIKFAHTVLPDGTIQADTQQFPGVLQRVPPHHRSARVMFVRMLRAVPGDILEFEMTFDEPYVDGDDLFHDEFFVRETLPVLSASYTLIAPRDLDLYFDHIGVEKEPQITPLAGSGQTSYRWDWDSAPPLKAEPDMPPYRDVGESVIVSNARTWDAVADWWHRHTENKYKVTEELQDLLRRILLDADGAEEKIAAIYKYVKYKVAYAGFDYDWANPEPHPSVGTMKDSEGDAKDQAVLLKTFLNEAGIPADVALVRTREAGAPVEQAAGLREFNHVMVVARNGDKEYFLDPSRKFYQGWQLPARDMGASALRLGDDAVELLTVPWDKDDGSRRELTVELEMKEDFTLTGTLRVEFEGREDARMKNDLNTWEQNKTVNFVRTLVSQTVPGGNFTQVEVFNQKKIDRNARIEAKVQVTEPWITDATPATIRLLADEVLRPDYLSADRVHPLHLMHLRQLRIKSRIKLPASLQVAELPADVAVDTPYIVYKARFRQAEGAIVMEGSLREKQYDVSREDYDAWRAAYEKAIDAFTAPVAVKPVTAKAPSSAGTAKTPAAAPAAP